VTRGRSPSTGSRSRSVARRRHRAGDRLCPRGSQARGLVTCAASWECLAGDPAPPEPLRLRADPLERRVAGEFVERLRVRRRRWSRRSASSPGEPAEGRPGSLAGRPAQGPDPRRADARHRRGGQGGDLPPHGRLANEGIGILFIHPSSPRSWECRSHLRHAERTGHGRAARHRRQRGGRPRPRHGRAPVGPGGAAEAPAVEERSNERDSRRAIPAAEPRTSVLRRAINVVGVDNLSLVFIIAALAVVIITQTDSSSAGRTSSQPPEPPSLAPGRRRDRRHHRAGLDISVGSVASVASVASAMAVEA